MSDAISIAAWLSSSPASRVRVVSTVQPLGSADCLSRTLQANVPVMVCDDLKALLDGLICSLAAPTTP
jgi:hypothetical protein